MAIVLNGTSGITNDSGYTGDGVSFADSTPANTLVTTSGGNVGIGTSSPVAKLELGAPNAINTTNTFRISNPYYNNWDITNGVGAFLAFSRGGSEFMRIDSSGNLLVGRTSSADIAGTTNTGFLFKNQQLQVTGPSTVAYFTTAASGAQTYISFYSQTTATGSITTNGTTTSYVTTSDYRLKENIAPMTGALAKVAALKPVTYTWKSTGETDEGFIAHELAEVCPQAVTGEKDAVDAEGKPQYQGIDTSFLVATLTAAIQELKAINDAQAQTIESLTARVVALETQP